MKRQVKKAAMALGLTAAIAAGFVAPALPRIQEPITAL